MQKKSLVHFKQLKRRIQKGFTLVELMIALMIFTAIGIGIQSFMVSSITSLALQRDVAIAENVTEMISNQIVKNKSSFTLLHDGTGSNNGVSSNYAGFNANPMQLGLYSSDITEMGQIINSSEIQEIVDQLVTSNERNAITTEANKLEYVRVDLFASPLIISDSPVVYSSTQVLLETRVKWKFSKAATGTRQETITRIISRDFST